MKQRSSVHLSRNVVRRQEISEDKREIVKLLRREMTGAEKVLWRRLRGNQVGGLHFRRQQIIQGFIVDFYCDSAALAIEVDGDIHLSTQEYDRDRDRSIEGLGIRVLRFSNEQVQRDIEAVLISITTAAIDAPP